MLSVLVLAALTWRFWSSVSELHSTTVAWYTAETLPRFPSVVGRIELTDESKERGLVLLVVEAEVEPNVLGFQPLTNQELEDFNRRHESAENFPRTTHSEAWRFRFDASQYKVHTPDGSTYTAMGFKMSGNEFEPVVSFEHIKGGSKPESFELGVFFVLEQVAIENGELTFQIKSHDPIRLTTANRRRE